MAISIREMASDCLGVEGEFSVVKDVLGYIFGAPAREIPLVNRLESMKGQAINLCPILVGFENDLSGSFTRADAEHVQFAIDVLRELYAQENLGVREIFWRRVGMDDVGGFEDIDTSAEASDLTQSFSGNDNDGLDVFYVGNVDNADGWSPIGGPCNKNANRMNGAVCQVLTNDFVGGVLLAHELGHYLGLGSGPDITNVMGEDPDGDGVDSINSTSVNLTAAQGSTMRSHCSVNPAC